MRIIYEVDTSTKKVAVVIPTPEWLLEHTMEELVVKVVPTGARYEIVEDAVLPSDRTFREAWRMGVRMGITVNIPAAKIITKERLREERKPLLEAQDILFQRALETSASTTAIVAEKERLRDITDQVDALSALADLKTISCEVS